MTRGLSPDPVVGRITSLIELATPRLLLRRWKPEDRDDFARLNGDARVMRYFPALLERTASDAMVERIEEGFAARGWGLWAAELADRACFIGFIGLSVVPATLPCAPGVEVGWRLAHEHWGHGYATEGARAALWAGFEWLGLGEIVSFTARENRRSRAVMERLGMTEDVAGAFDHPALAPGHALAAHRLYRLARGDWNDRDAAHLFHLVT